MERKIYDNFYYPIVYTAIFCIKFPQYCLFSNYNLGNRLQELKWNFNRTYLTNHCQVFRSIDCKGHSQLRQSLLPSNPLVKNLWGRINVWIQSWITWDCENKFCANEWRMSVLCKKKTQIFMKARNSKQANKFSKFIADICFGKRPCL